MNGQNTIIHSLNMYRKIHEHSDTVFQLHIRMHYTYKRKTGGIEIGLNKHEYAEASWFLEMLQFVNKSFTNDYALFLERYRPECDYLAPLISSIRAHRLCYIISRSIFTKKKLGSTYGMSIKSALKCKTKAMTATNTRG